MKLSYSFGYIKNLDYFKDKFNLQNSFFFKKNNFFFISEEKIQHFHSIDINLFVIGRILNKEFLIKNYNFNIEKNYLVEIYKKYGFEKMINLVDGEVLILILDSKKNIFYFNNSKFGTRPCYYFNKNSSLIFSSNIKFFINFLPDLNLNENFVKRFLSFHYRHIENNEDTVFQNVKKFLPSHFLKYSIKENKLIKKRWYKIKINNIYKKLKENELCEQLIYLIKKSLKKRINVRNFFCSLSGGLDSSTIVSLLNLQSKKKIDAATVSYQDQTYDEVNDIKKFAKQNVENWHIVKLDNKNINDKILESCTKADKPLFTSTWFTDFFLKKEMSKKGYKFAVSGLGGDQLHAGEYDYFHYHFADLIKNKSKNLKDEINGWIKHHNHKVYKKSYKNEINFLKKLMLDKSDGIDHIRNKRYFLILKKKYHDKYQVYTEKNYNSYLLNKSYNETYYELLPGCLSHDFDNSNYFNIENIYPYLDGELFEFMFSINNNFKIQKGVQKILLRKSTSKFMLSETNQRIKKTGWNSPVHLWFSGKKDNILYEIINDKNSKIFDFLDLIKTQKLFKEHNKIVNNKLNKENHMMFFWQLVSLELWLQGLKKT